MWAVTYEAGAIDLAELTWSGERADDRGPTASLRSEAVTRSDIVDCVQGVNTP